MKIAISANGTTLENMVDPRFGRCQNFIIVDPETLQFESSENSNAAAGGGAGIATAQSIASKGIEAVLTGNCGPNAYQVLSAAGIKVITGVSGKILDAVNDYKAGKYKESSQANVPDHFGSRGGGMGMGRGRGMGANSVPGSSQGQPDKTQEIDSLKAQSQELSKQLNDIQERIGKLEKNS